jgi:secreted trypsin-like serine protease
MVHATYKGVTDYYICADQWSSDWSDLACKQMGFESASLISNKTVSSQYFLQVTLPFDSLNTTGNSTFFLMKFLQITTCSSKQAVSMKCNPTECGIRTVAHDSVGPYIINGDLAARGAWPWQAIVYLYGSFECGGTILNDRWILTAGHCVYKSYWTTYPPYAYTVKLGSIYLDGFNNDTQTFSVDLVLRHPLFNYDTLTFDSGLLRLSTRITFTDTVRPICMPSPNVDLNQFRVCVITGFGQFSSAHESSQLLLQAKVDILPYAACLNNILSVTGTYVYEGITLVDKLMICLGSIPTVTNIGSCHGDSGGPLSCQDHHGTWTEVGICSYGFPNRQGVDCSLSIYSGLSSMIDWVQNQILIYP